MSGRVTRDTSATAVLDRIVHRVGARVLVVSSVVLGLGFLVTSVLMSSYRFDDNSNKLIRSQLEQSGQTLWDVIQYWTSTWIADQGRFFPGSVAWTDTVFYLFNSRLEYKMLLSLVILFAIAAACLVVWLVTANRTAVAIAAFALLATIQIRNYFDGIIAFTGLVPLTLGLSLLSCAVLIRFKGPVSGTLAGAAYLAAMFTYETVFLFFPAMMALVFLQTRSWVRTAYIAVPALIEIIIVIVLRSAVGSNTAAAYTVSLDPAGVARTFGKQFLSTFPVSQWWLGYKDLQYLSGPVVLFSIVVVGVPIFLAAWSLARQPALAVANRTLLVMTGFGLWIWIPSALLIGITSRWQTELSLGQGYLGVVYGYFGLTLCVTAGWLALNRRFATGPVPTRAQKVWPFASSAVIAIVCSLTIAGNLVVTA